MKSKSDKPQKQRVNRVRFPIGFKLVTIITILVLLSLGTITVLVSMMVSQDVRLTAEDNNFTVNRRSAAEAETSLGAVRSNALVLLETIHAAGSGSPLSREAASFFFERNQDVAAIVLASPGRRPDNLLINTRFFLSREIESSLVETFIGDRGEALERAAAGETLLLNGVPDFGVPVLALFFPWQEGGQAQGAAVFFSLESLSETFGTGTNTSYMINGDGYLLIHPDYELVRAGVSMENRNFIRAMRENTERSMQNLYTDEDGVQYFGAFTKLNIGGAVVITVIEYDKVFEGIFATTRRNGYLTAAVLFFSILLIWFFSKSISGPLRKLADAAQQIKEGKFEVNLPVKTRDEIGLLTGSFTEMGHGLAERERLKDAFGRFTNREIAERAMRGELALGGETRHATIFFSDIRSFTEISEKLPPSEVVEFLNDYLTRMVACVNRTHGVVDKYIGDAVMAVWGAPVSAGSPAADALNGVRSALSMRVALGEYNRDRGSKPLIRNGCGLNTGDVVAGQIGSQERMEYTVIGDAVNLASRTEALNKPLGTDILITENTWTLIKDLLITEEMPPVRVKGKEKPVRLFAVVNLRAAPGEVQKNPTSLAQVRAMLGTRAPDLMRVDTGSEEKKYKIGGE